jgi:hypothetical protein
MKDLKEKLKESFIKPLKFKFLVQKLEKDGLNNNSSKIEGTQHENEKNDLYIQINEAYKKFNVSIPT